MGSDLLDSLFDVKVVGENVGYLTDSSFFKYLYCKKEKRTMTVFRYLVFHYLSRDVGKSLERVMNKYADPLRRPGQ